MRGAPRVRRWGGTVVALAAAVGSVVGLRSVVAVELPGIRNLLGLPSLPREAFGIHWSVRAAWPAQIQEAALGRLTGLLAALFLAAAGVALLNTLVLLFEAGASRRREVAVRAALGEGPSVLARRLLADVRRLVVTGLVLGLLLGLVWGGALRAAWPGVVADLGWLDATVSLMPALALMCALAVTAHVWTGVSVARGRTLARALLSGERATAAPGEAFQRRILAALQSGVAGAVTLAALALALGVGTSGSSATSAVTTLATTVAAPGEPGEAWRDLLQRLAGIPGLEAETLSTPGALVGLGIRDNATAQCGNCYRGLMYLPFWGAIADHHAVGPGFFGMAGMTLGDGRDITWADGPDAPRVAVVNRTFANTAFEDGEPLGRKIRVGSDLDAWYEVVGIVEDEPVLGVGGDDLARAAVYLSALQHPPARGSLLLQGSEAAVSAALDVAASRGFAPTEVQSVEEVRQGAQAPMQWLGRLGILLAMLTLALAVHGGHTTALQVARRRVKELAVRRALGATDGRIVRHVLAGAAGTALGGSAIAIFFGALFVALLRKVSGGVPPLAPGTYVGVVAVLMGAGLLASTRAAREAVSVEPGLVVE